MNYEFIKTFTVICLIDYYTTYLSSQHYNIKYYNIKLLNIKLLAFSFVSV